MLLQANKNLEAMFPLSIYMYTVMENSKAYMYHTDLTPLPLPSMEDI